MPASSSRNGALKMADNGTLSTATVNIANNKLDAFEKVADPKRHMQVQVTNAAVCKPYPAQYPPGKPGPTLRRMQSIKPTMFMAVLRAWAKKNKIPMEPPNSGPSDLEIR